MTITAADARAYLTRWTAVNEREVAELRSTSMETKLQQLESLMASREIFDADADRKHSVDNVRERWVGTAEAGVK